MVATPERDWLTVKESAAESGFHEQTIRSWKKRDLIVWDPLRVGRGYMIYYPSVIRHIVVSDIKPSRPPEKPLD